MRAKTSRRMISWPSRRSSTRCERGEALLAAARLNLARYEKLSSVDRRPSIRAHSDNPDGHESPGKGASRPALRSPSHACQSSVW
jgi:hypothetical protein